MHISKYIKLTLLLLVFLPGIPEKSFAVTPDSTEIIVIGTVHYDTDNFNSDSLLNIIKTISPGLILIEADTSYFTSDFEFEKDISTSFLETRAITKYKENNNVILRPYDIEKRDDFLNNYERREKEISFFSMLDMLYSAGNLPSETENLLLSLITTMETAEFLSLSTPYNINKTESDSLIREINYYTYDGIRDIIESTPDLQEYKTYWDENYDFWISRNDVMVEKIIHFTEEFKGNRIIVLCGFSHKPYIKDGLVESGNRADLILKEYWEY